MCANCKWKAVIVFNYSILHSENLYNVGTFVQINALVSDIVACNFYLNCEDCAYGNVLKGTIPGEKWEMNCM